MRRILFAWSAVATLAVLAAVFVAGASSASPHTCADYTNQAAAQRAHDTTDANHNGIYCESLPCPCLKSGDDSAGSTPSAPGSDKPASSRGAVGPSVTFGPVTKHSGCKVRGPLPDRGCTPGARFSKVTKTQVCRSGYTKVVRNVSQATKNAIYGAYGISKHFNGSTGEVDHLVSLELGGSNSRANLFPEAAVPVPGSHQKDRLENRLHDEVCTGDLTLRRAQKLIATDWVTAYRARFG